MNPDKQRFKQVFPRLAHGLNDAQIEDLLVYCRAVDIPAGRKLIRDRMPVESILLVLEGELDISIDQGDRTLHLGQAGPGQWLGEVSVLSGSMLASSNVTSRTPVRALKLHFQDFDRLIRDNDAVANVLLGDLIELLAARLRTSVAASTRMGQA